MEAAESLPTPYNPSPADGSTGQATTGSLTWSADGTSATDYYVDLSTSNPPDPSTSRICNPTANKAKSCDRGTLQAGTTYYWRVTTADGVGAKAGPVWSFTTQSAGTSLPTPYNPSPADGSTGQATTGSLTWSADGTSATEYYVDIGTSDPPGTRICNPTANKAKSCDRGTLQAGTTYYWRVTTADGVGAKAGPVWSFTTQSAGTSLPTPYNPSPADGSTGQATTGSLTWSADGTSATDYYVDLSTANPPTSRICNPTANKAKSCDRGTLLPGTTYYWRVTVADGIGAKAGPVWSFTTASGSSSLPTPYNPSPPDGSTGQAATGPLTWQADGTPLTDYYVDIGTSNPPTQRICNPTPNKAKSCDRGTLQQATTYYWRVTVADGIGAKAGPVWSFTTAASTAAPTLSYTGESGYVSDGVNPDLGDSFTTFVFRVRYASSAGLWPSYTRVVVDGVAYDMDYVSGSPTSGALYQRSMKLGAFHHDHRFEASDGTRLATGAATATAQGPDVGPTLQPRSNALMLMPGFNPPWPAGNDWTREIKSYWGARDSNFRARLVAEGWNLDGNAVYWGFYECDWSDPSTPGTADFVWMHGKDPLNPHAHGNSNHGDGRTYAQNHGGSTGTCAGKHDRDTSIEHLAYHWAWGVSNYEAARGWPCVDVLAHSMGGAIVRYALAEVQRMNSDFPDRLCVDSAVTLSSPHKAVSNFQVGGCSNVYEYYQCDEMNGESDTAFYVSLDNTIGRDPKGTTAEGWRPGKTTWTIVGTAGDDTIPGAMATGGMTPAHKIYYDEDIGHNSYFNQPAFATDSPSARARVTHHGAAEYAMQGAPWPALLADRSLAYDEHACGAVGGPKGADYVPLRKGVAVVGEPPAPPMLACGYAIHDVPAGATLTFRMVGHAQGRTWSVYHVNSLGVIDFQPSGCTKPPRATYLQCVVPSAMAGTWRVEVDVTDTGSANTIVMHPFLIGASY